MIKSFTVTNFRGEELHLELDNPWETGLIIKSVDGLGPPKANINTTEVVTTDGSRFNSARLIQRNIVFYFVFTEVVKSLSGFVSDSDDAFVTDSEIETIEDIRLKTYKYFPLKRPLTIRVETDKRVLQITGYVESNEPSIFSSQEGCQISVVCPDPYFYDVNGVSQVDFTTHEPLLQFPISNEVGGSNTGDAGGRQLFGGTSVHVTGSANATVTYKASQYDVDGDSFVEKNTSTHTLSNKETDIDAYGEEDDSYYSSFSLNSGTFKSIEYEIGRIVSSPQKNVKYDGDAETGITIVLHANGSVVNPSIACIRTNESMTITKSLQSADEIIISTVKGKKSATYIRNGASSNILSLLGQNIPWFTLVKGDNQFRINAESGLDALDVSIRYNQLYEGV